MPSSKLQSYGVAATADKFLEKIKQEAAESKAAVEIATGSIDTQAIERERTSRKIKAASILQQFEVEMGIVKPAATTADFCRAERGRADRRADPGLLIILGLLNHWPVTADSSVPLTPYP